MKRRTIRTAFELLAMVISHHDDSVEGVSHEVAHAVLLFGKVFDGCVDACNMLVEKMSDSAADRHELQTMALQRAAMKDLGFPVSVRKSIHLSQAFFRSEEYRENKTTAEIAREVDAIKVSPGDIQAFVAVVETMAAFERPRGV